MIGREALALEGLIVVPDDAVSLHEIVRRVIAELNERHVIDDRIAIGTFSSRGFAHTGVEGELKAAVENSDFVLFLLEIDAGPPLSSPSRTVTHAVFEHVMNVRRIRAAGGGQESPEILVYARRRADGSAMRSALLEAMVGEGTTPAHFESDDDLRRLVERHLLQFVRRLKALRPPGRSARRVDLATLNGLLRFGRPKSRAATEAVIVAPSRAPTEPQFLLSPMGQEDVQAASLLSESVRLAGLAKPKLITADCYDRAGYAGLNKIFCCVPRSRPARRCLEELDEKCFAIEAMREAMDPASGDCWMLRWRRHGHEVHVASPLTTYLKTQRLEDDRWREEPGRVTGVDFGVLARFTDPSTRAWRQPLSKLFVFGLRGLGTWGAAFYLRHGLDALARDHDPGEAAVQILLRVVYRNGDIVKVEDVTRRDQAYFSREHDPERIRAVIENPKR